MDRMIKTTRLNFEMLTAHKPLLAAIGLTILLSAILLLPYPYRDGMLVIVIGLGIVLARNHFEPVWFAFLMLLPLLRLNGGLFQVNTLEGSRILLAGLSIVFLWREKNSPPRALIHSNGFRFFGLFILANILSAFAVLRVDSLLSAGALFEPLLYFTVSYGLVRANPENLPRTLRALLRGALVLVAVGLYEMITQQSVAAFLNPDLARRLGVYLYGEGSNRIGLGGRISSLIGQPVMAGLYFVLMPIVGLYYWTQIERSRVLSIFFGLLCVMLVFATGTRGAMLGLAAAIFIFALLAPQRWSRRLWMLGALIGGVSVLLILLPNLAAYLCASLDFEANTPESRNITGRFALTMELLRIFQANWLFGYGPGAIQRDALAGVLPTVPGIKSLGGVENQYATILAGGGILAGLTYLLFMLGVAWDAFAMLRQPHWRVMGLCLGAMFAAYFVFAATEMTLTTTPNLFLMALYGAFAARFEDAQLEARA